MKDLTIIKVNGSAYIDSREVADIIDKQHKHLLRDIRGYCEILEKFTEPNFGPSEFFLESSYFDSSGRKLPCYLLSKMGAEMVANKLIGKKGVVFTAMYVRKFNEMEAAERAAEIEAQSKPRLGEYNGAVKNILNGMSYASAPPNRVMGFLREVYEPLGIEVLTDGDDYGYQTATEIARDLEIYSETGRPHGHAVSAIISKLGIPEGHMVIVPYGMVGTTARYDEYVVEAVWEWIVENDFPINVPHLNFDYHIYYSDRLPARQLSYFDCDKDEEFRTSREYGLNRKALNCGSTNIGKSGIYPQLS